MLTLLNQYSYFSLEGSFWRSSGQVHFKSMREKQSIS